MGWDEQKPETCIAGGAGVEGEVAAQSSITQHASRCLGMFDP